VLVDAFGHLVAILAQCDCFRPALDASSYQKCTGKVADFHSTDVATPKASTALVAAAEAFLERPYRSCPVMRGDRLVGLLHRDDLLRALPAAGRSRRRARMHAGGDGAGRPHLRWRSDRHGKAAPAVSGGRRWQSGSGGGQGPPAASHFRPALKR